MLREEKIVSIGEMEKAFEPYNFGDSSSRKILEEGVMKVAAGFKDGYSAVTILQNLGLIGKNKFKPVLTKKGKCYLWAVYRRMERE